MVVHDPIPGGRRVLAFLIDADLPAARIAHQRRWLNETAARAREITAVLAESQFAPAAGGFIVAHSSVLVPCAGDRWLAVGDASMSFDPLAAQGLLHALFTGLCRGRNRGRLLAPPAKDQSAAARLRKQRVRLLQQFRQTADDAVGADWGVWEQADSVAVVQNRVNAKPLRCRDLPFEATATIQV